MKKLLFIIALIFTASFANSQTIKEEKITYAEYDDLKYIQSVVPDYTFTENVSRYYDSTNIPILSMQYDSKPTQTIINLTHSIDFTVGTSVSGNLKKYGVNRVLSFNAKDSSGKIYYFVYLNNEQILKTSSK